MIKKLYDFYLTFRGIVKYYTFIKKSQFFDNEKIRNFQFIQLKKLLIESNIHVPYYKKLFKNLNFNPILDFNSLDDLTKIPILSKDNAKLNSHNLVNNKYVKKSLKFRTSGSTGRPFEIFVHPNQWIIEQAVIWRHWNWGGYNFRDPLAMIRSYIPDNENELFKTDIFTNFTFYSPFHLSDTNIDMYLNSMIKKGIKILRGYPSSLTIIADYVLRTNHKIPKFKLILTASEVLTDYDRSKIELAFNSKVFNHYGLAEQIVMMGNCSNHEGLHNYDEYGYLELLDTEFPNIKRIIGTNLHNYTTPLLRYDTGDLAIVENTKCSCGRVSTIVKNIIGRNDVYIKSSSGLKIPTVNFYTLFENFPEIIQWQIIQRNLDLIEVIIKSFDILPETLTNIEVQLKKRLPIEIKVKINTTGNFVQKNEGKINPFISEIND